MFYVLWFDWHAVQVSAEYRWKYEKCWPAVMVCIILQAQNILWTPKVHQVSGQLTFLTAVLLNRCGIAFSVVLSGDYFLLYCSITCCFVFVCLLFSSFKRRKDGPHFLPSSVIEEMAFTPSKYYVFYVTKLPIFHVLTKWDLIPF